MSDNDIDSVPELLALAWKLEGIGQYNNAKMVRAVAEAISRRAAYQLGTDWDPNQLAGKLEKISKALKDNVVTAAYLPLIKNGANVMASGRVAMFAESPHPYVCRTCGHLVAGEPEAGCPVCGARYETYMRFPPVYWLDNLNPFEALKQLRRTPIEVSELIANISEEKLARSPKEGEWSIRNAVSHLRDAQGVFEFRVKLMIEEQNPWLESKAVFEWAASNSDRPSKTQEIYESYFDSRRRVLALLEELPLKDWWRTGRHEEFGTVTIMQQASYFASHELTHFPQMQALV